MKFKSTLALLTLIISAQVFAAVWTTEASRVWTPADEQGYAQFVSKNVTGDFFKRLGSPFSQIKLDCADAAYALRAYYANRNGLPFVIKGKYGNNKTNQFDYVSAGDKRLAAFITYIVGDNGTEQLSGSDSFPVAIKSIQAGDMFLYKIETSPNVFSRHTYIIKNVNTNGTFEVLYSTQARRDAGLPMNTINQYTFPNPRWVPNHTAPLDRNKWGFKRFRTSEQIGAPLTSIPEANGEQYTLALQLGDRFFDYVREQRTTIKETAEQLLSRMYGALCHELNDRVEIVAMAQEVRAQTNNKCMDAATYDTYSTPSRDGGILNSYNKLKSKATELKQNGTWNEISRDLKVNVEGLFDPNRDAATAQSIKNSCGFHAKQGLKTDMALFYEALIKGSASNHPNDSLFNRWGIKSSTTAALTTCPRY